MATKKNIHTKWSHASVPNLDLVLALPRISLVFKLNVGCFHVLLEGVLLKKKLGQTFDHDGDQVKDPTLQACNLREKQKNKPY